MTDHLLDNFYSYIAQPIVNTNTSSLPVQDISFGHQLVLSCVSSGSPPDIFMWMKDGVPITNFSSVTALNYTNTSAVFSTNYTISNLSISDMGIYTCVVRNPIGSDSKNINISISKYGIRHTCMFTYVVVRCLILCTYIAILYKGGINE